MSHQFNVIKNICFILCLYSLSSVSFSANLLEVYQEAQRNDSIFQQAVEEKLASQAGVPISIAALLPQILAQINPSISRTGASGSNYVSLANNTPDTFSAPRNVTQRTYTLNLSLTQTLFDFAQFAEVQHQATLSKKAEAILNAALQDLIIRVAEAYFLILQDEDNLQYSRAYRAFYAKQLEYIKRQYQVGLKTLTEVHTAQAAYDEAQANYIRNQTTLANHREQLRVITGKYYPHLAHFNQPLPLVSPQPKHVDQWVKQALRYNWQIKAAQYDVESKRHSLKQQFAGHLPTISAQTNFSRQYTNNISSYNSLNEHAGPGTYSQREVGIDISIPIFSGGAVSAHTDQAKHLLEASLHHLETVVRNTENQTRQSFLNVIAHISEIKAHQQSIKSNQSALKGMESSYHAGIETLVNVLNQQQKLFEAETQYASARYAYLNQLLSLKLAAGTLSFEDLYKINRYLVAC